MSDFDDKTAREMVQAKLLGRIFASNVAAGDLALKGGMAMRVGMNSRRLTKDIDLMSPPGMNHAERRITGALADLKQSGLVSGLTWTQPKRTDTTWRWKIGGRVGATIINLTVEVSRRTPLPEGHVNRLSWQPPEQYGMAPIMVDCIDMPMMAAAKTSCVINPQREAPRDLFDLHMLITTHVRPPIEAILALGRENLELGLKALWDKIEKMDYATAQTELLPHLEPAMRAELTEQKWDEIRMTVGTSVQEWLQEALDEPGAVKANASAGGMRA